jgi:phospholipase/carboxylesterase
LIGLAPLMRDALPDTYFVSPNAPAPCGMGGWGYEWFPLVDRNPAVMAAGAMEAAPILDAYIDDLCKRLQLTDAHIALVGFSQGTMMALHTGLRRARNLAGIIGFSGAMVGGTESIVSKPPVCLIHGELDDVVPFGAMAIASEALHHVGVPVETHARPGLPHSIDPEGVDIAVKFLRKVFEF